MICGVTVATPVKNCIAMNALRFLVVASPILRNTSETTSQHKVQYFNETHDNDAVKNTKYNTNGLLFSKSPSGHRNSKPTA